MLTISNASYTLKRGVFIASSPLAEPSGCAISLKAPHLQAFALPVLAFLYRPALERKPAKVAAMMRQVVTPYQQSRD
jgi:hypothetical protein